MSKVVYLTQASPMSTAPVEEVETERVPSPKHDEYFSGHNSSAVSYFLPSTQRKPRSNLMSKGELTPSSMNSLTQHENREHNDPTRQLVFSSSQMSTLLPTPASQESVELESFQRSKVQFETPQQLEVGTSSVDSETVTVSSISATPRVDDTHHLHSDSDEAQHLTIVTLEVHACTRGNLLPDPQFDPISAIVYHVKFLIHGAASRFTDVTGVLLLPAMPQHGAAGKGLSLSQSSTYSAPTAHTPPLGLPPGIRVDCFTGEHALLHGLVRLVRQYDPDIVCGYEVQKQSLGYIIERAALLQRNLCEEMSRIIPLKITNAPRRRFDPAANYATTHSSGITIPGRVVLNLWRILQSELKLNIYTYENVCWNVLREWHYHVPAATLSVWVQSDSSCVGG